MLEGKAIFPVRFLVVAHCDIGPVQHSYYQVPDWCSPGEINGPM